jgi:hypothetical protein
MVTGGSMGNESRRLAILHMLSQMQNERSVSNQQLSLTVDTSSRSTSAIINTVNANDLKRKRAQIATATEDMSRRLVTSLLLGNESLTMTNNSRLLAIQAMLSGAARANGMMDDPYFEQRSHSHMAARQPIVVQSLGGTSSSTIEKLLMDLILQNRAAMESHKGLLANVQSQAPTSLLERGSSKFCMTTTPPLSRQSSDVVQPDGGSITSSAKTFRGITGRPAVILYQPQDDEALSAYQCFVRQQIEYFEANDEDVATTAKGRNKPIILGQVGIRCRHCATLPPKYRNRGAMYYPKKKSLIYQAAQSVAGTHLQNGCPNVSEKVKHELAQLRTKKSLIGGGKMYWDRAATAVGVYETESCLRFDVCGLIDSS